MSGFSPTDEHMMRVALRLGARHLGQTWPNPSVGCVIASGTRVLGRAVTAKGGAPHAETQALAQAGDNANGATAYVTLEPCAHNGRTPPCANALIASGIARVVYASDDPNPDVNGQGAKLLRDAGITVESGLLKREADIQHHGFFKRITKNRPLVTLKLATSLDGKIATRTGESQWITNPMARRFTHLLRATHDAIMVGAGTMRSDDPSLTVRGLGASMPSPVRVILSNSGVLDKTATLAKTAKDIPVWMMHSAELGEKDRIDSVTYTKCKKGLDLDDVLSQLAGRGITRVFCEGGAKLAASLIKSGHVDQLYLMQAGKIIGGDGLPALGDIGLEKLADAPEFNLVENFDLDGNTISHWRNF